MTIGERIKELRERAGYKRQGDFAAALGKPQSQVSDWENGRYRIEIETLTKIAATVNVALPDLLRGVDGYEAFISALSSPFERADADAIDDDVTDGYKRNDIPVVAEGDASPAPNLFWNEDGLRSDVEDRISRPYDVRDPRAYGVRVRGDSMIPRYQAGDTVVVSPNTPVQDGDEVYVALLSGERLIKRAKRARGGWILESYNSNFEARYVTTAEIGTMHPVLWIRPRRRPKGAPQ